MNKQAAFSSKFSNVAQPAWYRTPVAAIPIAAATFIIGNLLLMIPWQVF